MIAPRYYARNADRARIFVDLGGDGLIGIDPVEVIRHAARRAARKLQGART